MTIAKVEDNKYTFITKVTLKYWGIDWEYNVGEGP